MSCPLYVQETLGCRKEEGVDKELIATTLHYGDDAFFIVQMNI